MYKYLSPLWVRHTTCPLLLLLVFIMLCIYSIKKILVGVYNQVSRLQTAKDNTKTHKSKLQTAKANNKNSQRPADLYKAVQNDFTVTDCNCKVI